MRNFGGAVVRDFTYIFLVSLLFSEMGEDGMLNKITFTLSDNYTTSVLLYV